MKGDLGPWSLVTQLGVTMVAAILLGLVVGLWIDGFIGTRPWATLVFSLLGVGVGSLAVARLVSSAIAQSDAERSRVAKTKQPDDKEVR